MIAFDIEIDNEKVLMAGVEDWSILALNVSGVRNAPPGEELRLAMGGLTEADVNGVSHHVRWDGRPLKVGSKLTVTIVNTDQPTRCYRSDHEAQNHRS